MKNTALSIGAVCSIVFLSVSLRGEPTAAQVSRLSNEPSCDLVAFEEDLDRLPHDWWVILHVQHPDDQVIFSRQWHGGSAFDSKRGRLILFGSDTHGNDWTNTPYFFHLERRRWTKAHDSDHPATYGVSEMGIPFAGANHDRPWAMHTFGALTYDEQRDELVVASAPLHLEPGRFTNALTSVWTEAIVHPTWTLDLVSGRWSAHLSATESFFAYGIAYSPRFGRVFGYKHSGVYALYGKPRRWYQVSDVSFLGYHKNVVFDTERSLLVAFGSTGGSNDIVIFDPEIRRHEVMPTRGRRPPKSEHVPMAFHRGLSTTVVLTDAEQQEAKDTGCETNTWLYDLESDAWAQKAGAGLPFRLGMNYNLEYAPEYELLLLVATLPTGRTAVLAYRAVR